MLRIDRKKKSKLQWDKVQDSAAKAAFGTGSMRDSQDNKGRYDLIPSSVILRLAQHYENGARKYAERNWEKGQPLSQYYNSAIRHLEHIKDGDLEEDHFAAAIWNVAAMIHHIDAMLDGTLPENLDSFGFVKQIKEQETFELLREYYSGEDVKVETHTITADKISAVSNTRWIPTLMSGMVNDGGILDGIINDNADRAKDVTTARLERVQGMNDEEWETYKRQANAVNCKLDPEELG